MKSLYRKHQVVCVLFFFAIAVVAIVGAAASDKDQGYEALFNSFTDDIPEACFPLKGKGSIGEGLRGGTWIIPSVSAFEMGSTNFTSVLDGFGKLNKFSFDANMTSVCYTSRMLTSGFYNQSKEKETVAPSVLFMPTSPVGEYSPAQILGGPNDNSYVNTIRLGSRLLSLTDSQYMLEVDINTIAVQSNVVFSDTLDFGKVATGSAHALMRGDCMIDIDPQQNLDGSDARVLLYEMCPPTSSHVDVEEEQNDNKASNEFSRTVLNSYATPYLPYMHSFGFTANYAILPHQSFHFDYSLVMRGEPLVDSIVNDTEIVIMILPLNGDPVIPFTLTQQEPFYYFHVVNSWESDDGNVVVMDLSCLSLNMLPYFTLEMERTKSIRDASNFGNVLVKRYTMYFQGDKQGTWTVEALTNSARSTDFPNYNKAYQGKANCVFYALEWFHDTKTYADMAVLKRDTCQGEGRISERYWHRDNYFPSEPTFIPRASSSLNLKGRAAEDEEDDGILLFTALHGKTNKSYLMIVDAIDMSTLEEIELPGIVTFTTHGEWFP